MRIGLGIRRSGVMSAGNSAAMRSAVVGAYFDDRPAERAAFGRALAEVTHRDPRAVEGALYVAELAAACARSPAGTTPAACHEQARGCVTVPALADAIGQARGLADRGVDVATAAAACGTSGYVLHSVSLATFLFLRFGAEPLTALTEAVVVGGDTDSNAAILGGWLGALHGAAGLPGHLIEQIHDGPFGPTHLRALADALARVSRGEQAEVPSYSAAAAFGCNVLLWPVVLAHGFRRLILF